MVNCESTTSSTEVSAFVGLLVIFESASLADRVTAVKSKTKFPMSYSGQWSVVKPLA
jgi:hypothetical protein